VRVAAKRGTRLAAALCWIVLSSAACGPRSSLPRGLGNQDFWSLIGTLSEPAGAFTLSDNLVSNEPHVAENARRLRGTGGVFIGVGPEQNFTYIVRMRPAMAFIIDIRRENRDLHLLYKALFETSADRAEFVSRLFSRPRPAGLGPSSSAAEIFEQFAGVASSPALSRRTAALVRDRLLTTRELPLSPNDLATMERALEAFAADGPEIRFWRSADVDAVQPSYRWLMTAVDGTGQTRSFLATEEAFAFVKDLHMRNLIVPIVGDFGGPAAIPRVGEYVRQRGDVIRAFYGSNVGVYLTSQQRHRFCGSLANLPAARDAWFIERDGVRTLASKIKNCLSDARLR